MIGLSSSFLSGAGICAELAVMSEAAAPVVAVEDGWPQTTKFRRNVPSVPLGNREEMIHFQHHYTENDLITWCDWTVPDPWTLQKPYKTQGCVCESNTTQKKPTLWEKRFDFNRIWYRTDDVELLCSYAYIFILYSHINDLLSCNLMKKQINQYLLDLGHFCNCCLTVCPKLRQVFFKVAIFFNNNFQLKPVGGCTNFKSVVFCLPSSLKCNFM